MTTMLYRFSEKEKPRKQKIHGLDMDHIVVEDSEIEDYLDEGWSKTPTAAQALQDGEDPASLYTEGDLDEDGYPWDERINVKDKSMTKKGLWKTKPGTKKETLDAVRDEIKPPEDASTPTDGEEVYSEYEQDEE